MAEKVLVKAEKRTETGKNINRRLRVQGKGPVVVYGGGSESLAAVAELKDLAASLRTDTGVNTVFSLDIEGEGINDVIFCPVIKLINANTTFVASINFTDIFFHPFEGIKSAIKHNFTVSIDAYFAVADKFT